MGIIKRLNAAGYPYIRELMGRTPGSLKPGVQATLRMSDLKRGAALKPRKFLGVELGREIATLPGKMVRRRIEDEISKHVRAVTGRFVLKIALSDSWPVASLGDLTISEKPLRIRGCLRKGEEEKFVIIDVEKTEDLENIARQMGRIIVECVDANYDAVIDARNRLPFRKRRE